MKARRVIVIAADHTAAHKPELTRSYRSSRITGQPILVSCAEPPTMAGCPRAAGPGGRGALPVKFHRTRSFIVSTILALATLLATVATAFADGNGGPFPR